MSEECLRCDCYDSDFGCTCPSIDKWYACPLEPEPTAEDFITINAQIVTVICDTHAIRDFS